MTNQVEGPIKAGAIVNIGQLFEPSDLASMAARIRSSYTEWSQRYAPTHDGNKSRIFFTANPDALKFRKLLVEESDIEMTARIHRQFATSVLGGLVLKGVVLPKNERGWTEILSQEDVVVYAGGGVSTHIDPRGNEVRLMTNLGEHATSVEIAETWDHQQMNNLGFMPDGAVHSWSSVIIMPGESYVVNDLGPRTIRRPHKVKPSAERYMLSQFVRVDAPIPAEGVMIQLAL